MKIVRKSVLVIKRDGFFIFVLKIIRFLNKKIYYRNSLKSYFLNRSTDTLGVTAQGLHTTLGLKNLSYTIVLPITNDHCEYLESTLMSLIQFSTRDVELLIGYYGKLPPEKIKNQIKMILSKSHLNFSIYELSSSTKIEVLQSLVDKVKNRFIFLASQYDLVRPDLFWRFEQSLQLFPPEEQDDIILYSNETPLDSDGSIKCGFYIRKPLTLKFPYIFYNPIKETMLFPKALVKKIKDPFSAVDHLCFLELLLKLNQAGAKFYGIPLVLCGTRKNEDPRKLGWAKNDNQLHSFSKFYRTYLETNRLSWTIREGAYSNTVRAIPETHERQKIHVVILYKNRKNMTLKTVKSLLKQKNVKLHLTLIDNGSKDLTISSELKQLGCEVFQINEPFNFSRLNNLAIKKSAFTSENILFMNNDVELRNDAVEEMSRWIIQPKIGVVGCKLLFPNGTIQHGGINIEFTGKANHVLNWNHVDYKLPEKKAYKANLLGVVDAVTAACILIKRETFERVNGFNEIFYPIAFSDTDLCLRIYRNLGLYSFYTPYARGIHYESISRGYQNIEDYEASIWLDHMLNKNKEFLEIGMY